MFPREEKSALSRRYSCGIGQPGVPGYRTIELPSEGLNKSMIIGPVIGSICLIIGLIIAFRYCRGRMLKIKAGDQRTRELTTNLEWVELAGNERSVRVRTADGVTRRSEEVDQLPAYEKIGKPGEILPTYLSVVDSDTLDDGSSRASTVTPSDTANPPQHTLEAVTTARPSISDR